MALLNTALWDTFLAGSTETSSDAGGVDVVQVVDELLWSLHAGSVAELYPWTEAQLYEWIDEAVKRLAAIACVFVGRQVGLTVPATATVAVPDREIATLHVTVGTTALHPSTSAEIESLDPSYQTRAGTPTRWYQDLLGLRSVGLYPVPDSEATLAQIYVGYPEKVEKLQSIVSGPGPLRGYLAMCVLAEAYGREGEMEMPDVAAHCRGRRDLYERMFRQYYGAAI